MSNKTDKDILYWASICESIDEDEQTDQRAVLNTESSTIKNMLSKINELDGALKSRLLMDVLGNLMSYFKERVKKDKSFDKLSDMCQKFYYDFYHEAFQIAKEQKL